MSVGCSRMFRGFRTCHRNSIFELSMRFRLCAVLFLSLPLSSCMYQKHDRNGPPDVSTMKSPQDIIIVFEKECIEQSHIRWAHDESRVRMQECGYFDSGDCRDSVDGWADWKIPVDNGLAVLTLSWSSVENKRRLRKPDCTLTLPRSTVAFKPAVIAALRRRGRSDGALLVNDEALQGTAQLPSRSVEVGRSTSYDIEDGWEVRYRER